MGKNFNKSGLLTILFFMIMVPILGYGSSAYKGICYLSGRDTLEEEYNKKRSFLIFTIIVIILSIILFLYKNGEDLQQTLQSSSSDYYIKMANIVVDGIKEKVESGKYTCDNNSDNLYFYYSNIFDEFHYTFSILKDPIEAYIKVVRNYDSYGNVNYSYYISMTDKRFGFPETLSDNLTEESVVEYKNLNLDYQYGNHCSTIIEEK